MAGNLIKELIQKKENHQFVEVLFQNKRPPEFSFEDVSNLICKGIQIDDISKGEINIEEMEYGNCLYRLNTLMEWNKKGLKHAKIKSPSFFQIDLEKSIYKKDQDKIDFFKVLLPEKIVRQAFEKVEK
jgi:hypothetical protein